MVRKYVNSVFCGKEIVLNLLLHKYMLNLQKNSKFLIKLVKL